MHGAPARLSAAALGLALAACSADAAPAPEPTLTTPGAFVAIEEGPSEIRLIRSFQAFATDDYSFLFASYYDDLAPSYAAAKAMAQDRALRPRAELMVYDLGSFSAPHRVVWFRTLNEQERSTLR